MKISVLSVDGQIILPAAALMPNVIEVMNLATLSMTAPTKFLYQEHHTTMANLIQDIITTTTEGPDIGNDTADHSHAPVYAATEEAVLEGTPYTLLPANTAACTALQPMDAPITPSCHSYTHPTLTTFPTGTTNATP